VYEHATELNIFHSLQIFDTALRSPRIRLEPTAQSEFSALFDALMVEYARPADMLKVEILRHWLRLIFFKAGRLQRETASSREIAPYYLDFIRLRTLIQRDLGQARDNIPLDLALMVSFLLQCRPNPLPHPAVAPA
jgi:hypothetical protein